MRAMNSEQIYQALCELAEKLDIEVSEQNFRASGISVDSGLCRVKGKTFFMMDKHKPVKRKVKLLAAELARHPHEDVYVVPQIRELLAKHGPARAGKGTAKPETEAAQPADAAET